MVKAKNKNKSITLKDVKKGLKEVQKAGYRPTMFVPIFVDPNIQDSIRRMYLYELIKMREINYYSEWDIFKTRIVQIRNKIRKLKLKIHAKLVKFIDWMFNYYRDDEDYDG